MAQNQQVIVFGLSSVSTAIIQAMMPNAAIQKMDTFESVKASLNQSSSTSQLVVLHHQLPGITWEEALATIKLLYQGIRVILITSKRIHRLKAAALYVDGFLPDPLLDERDIMDRLNSALTMRSDEVPQLS